MTTAIEAALTDAVIAHKKPITLQQGRGLRDLPIAIAGALATSRLNVTAWHPYNMLRVGDGATGIYYDRAVDPAATVIETPVFEDGFEYSIYFENIVIPTGVQTLTIGFNRQTSGYVDSATTVAMNGNRTYYGDIEMPRPFKTNTAKHVLVRLSSSTSGDEVLQLSAASVANQPITKIRLTFSAAVSTGRLALYRRRIY